MGDVVHAMPAVSDAAAHGFEIDWVVEEAFADIPRLHPDVDRTIPIAWRRWRKNLRASRGEMQEFFAALRLSEYEFVLDSQGLIKSALVALLSRGRRYGFAHTVAREPIASCFYHKRYVVPRAQHAVDRQRQLFAAVLGYDVPTAFAGLHGESGSVQAVPSKAMLLHGTTWATKHWPLPMWQALAVTLVEDGFAVLVTGGNDAELARADQLAQIPGVSQLPPMSLAELAAELQRCRLVIGVDSGLSHLSAALGIPTVGLYGPTDGELTGPRGLHASHLQSALHCSPCLRARCRYRGAALEWHHEDVIPPCFASVTPERVWQHAQAILER